MDKVATPELVHEWTDKAQELAIENWDSAKIVAYLRKRGCDAQLAEAITKSVQKRARAHGRKTGVVSIVTGTIILLAFAGMILGLAGTGVAIFAPKLALVAVGAAGMIIYGIFQVLFG
jgi:hypothetical protein